MEGVYTEAHHDHYDASQLTEDDKGFDLGDNNIKPYKPSKAQQESDKAFEKFYLVVEGKIKSEELTDKEVLILVREQQSDFIKNLASRRNLIPSAEELL